MQKWGGSFNVDLGACNGAEMCEFIGIIMLFSIAKKYGTKKFGLYKDDELCALKKSETFLGKIKKCF